MPELMWHERHLVGFENRLKDEDRMKAKIAASLAMKGRTVAEAVQLIPDAIRYTFQYDEADYGRHLLADIALAQERYWDLIRLRNFWLGEQYKGISSVWRGRGTSQLLEMQFHTETSYHAMTFTAERPYARLRSAQTCAQEELELEAFQRMVYASVPVPPGAHDIPGYPDRDDWEIPGKRIGPGQDVTYYAIVDDLSSRARPAGVMRRTYRDGGRRDEAFARDLAWHHTSFLISAERGDLENDLVRIAPDQASHIVERITRSVVSGSAR
jgi:hypothetical protein